MNPIRDKFAATTIALGMAALLLFGVFSLHAPVIAVAHAEEIPALATAPAAAGDTTPAKTETVVFAGGCFWGVQGVFQHVRGVLRAVSGYAGGSAASARYEIVGSGRTGHAESVEVTYDPAQVSYAELMRVFFSVAHDPRQLDYQGPDHGSQYRSAIFTRTPEQFAQTQAYIAQLNKTPYFNGQIVTRVTQGDAFYPAEDYHQDYLTLHPDAAYIRINDLPKLADLKRIYPTLYREQPVLVRKPVISISAR